MKLIVKNFGPIKNVEINSKQLTIFIGPQASGKSVLAKLMAIFQDFKFLTKLDLQEFLSIYNIEFLTDKTYIEYIVGDVHITCINSKININSNAFKHKSEIDDFILELSPELRTLMQEVKKIPEFIKLSNENKEAFLTNIIEKSKENIRDGLKTILNDRFLYSPLYIPTERVFVARISDFLYNFIDSNIQIPKSTINFGARFENARNKLSSYKIPFFENVEYSYDNNSNKLKLGNDKIINLTQSSSGMQSVIPIALLIEYFSKQKATNFVIEEPELNLYPTTQKKVVEFITEKCLNKKHNLIVTTHSPYILTSFANLIEANNTAEINSEAKKKVLEIIPEKNWIDFKNVSAYYINNGKATDILDYENKTIDANAIDDVSDIIAEEFDTLLNIKYGE